MGKAKLRVDHGPIDEDIVNSLTDEEKAWLRSWNRQGEIPGEESTPAEAANDGDQDVAEYDDYSVAELKDMLKERDLPTSGNKDELVARLEEDDASEDDDDDE